MGKLIPDCLPLATTILGSKEINVLQATYEVTLLIIMKIRDGGSLFIYMWAFSASERSKCNLDPDLGYGGKIPASKTREQFPKGLQSLNNLCSDSFSLSYGTFTFQTKRTNGSLGVFLESPSF